MQELRNCQKQAIDAFEKYYYDDEEYDRGIISMCCGAGKTRTTYEIIKLCSNKYSERFFVIATSRKELIYQVAEEYLEYLKKDNNFDFELKIIGGSGEKYSNKTLKNSDDIENTIQSIVCHKKKTLVIVTTYQSSKKIIEAVNGDSDLYPDLVILDEAHNTTGDNDKDNQELIRKSNEGDNTFSSQKYLFMTATPVELLMKNTNAPFQNDETVYTMTNKNLYGEIIYEYRFIDGIKDNIIVNFKTIYYTQTGDIPKDIEDQLKNGSKAEKNNTYFKTISSFLINEIKKNKLKRILVYLANQAKMKIMKKYLDIESKNFKCNIYTIISDDSKGTRENTRKLFSDDKVKEPNILLSVGIFDEGVDEKCIDSVMFAEERNTESRIVQNIGRCLRVYPGKKEAFVIIPNIVYETDVEDDDLSKKYSSYYETIRKVADALKRNIKNNFCKKYVKGDDPYNSDEDENDKIDQCDKFEKNKDNLIKQDEKIDETKVYDLSEYYESQSTKGSISNEDLNKLKEKAKAKKIDTIKKWSVYVKSINNPYLVLHKEFKKYWISWGDFLYDKTYTYEEAKKIFKNELKDKFKTSVEWIEYQNKILINELENKRETGISDEFVKKIEKIPNRPKEYYKGEWIDWNDFLGTNEFIQIVGVINENGSTEKASGDRNLQILVNTDNEKVNNFKNGEYNDVECDNKLLDQMKKYIDEVFGIDCILQVRVFIKKNGNYEKCCIHCRKTTDNKYFIPLIIFPEENKYKYDQSMLKKNTPLYDKDLQLNRTSEEFVKNANIIKLFGTLIKYCRDKAKESKKTNKNDNNLNIEKNEIVDKKNIFNDGINSEKKIIKKEVKEVRKKNIDNFDDKKIMSVKNIISNDISNDDNDDEEKIEKMIKEIRNEQQNKNKFVVNKMNNIVDNDNTIIKKSLFTKK